MDYDIGEEIGKGSFSAVYKGTKKSSGQRVAIKVIDKTKLNPKDISVIESEIRILEKMEHPNILKFYEHYFEQNKAYIILELCEGGELFDRIVKRDFYTEADAQGVLRAIASGLKYCHERKIIHRDLKPENILLLNEDEDSPIKIADFGFAKKLDEDLTTTVVGTPNYVAPEILLKKPYDESVDLWSFGVIAYVLLSGYVPFFAGSDSEFYEKIKTCDYTFQSPFWDNVSEDAKDMISKLLVLNPSDRLNIHQVLEHPWMANSIQTKDITPALTELRSLQARRRLKRSIGAVVAAGRMMSLLKGNGASPEHV